MGNRDSWKKALLSSGVPLEATVARTLQRHDCFVFGDEEFLSPTPEGEPKLRSIDAIAWWDLPVARLELVIECKYRRPGVRWFFLPASAFLGARRDWITNCLVSPVVPPWLAPPIRHPPTVRFGHQPVAADCVVYPIAAKGVEILPGIGTATEKDDSATNVAINTAVHQVRFAAASHMFSVPPLGPEDLDAYLHRQFRFLLPIVVTTAEILILKADTGVKEVETAAEVTNVAEPASAVILRTDPSRMLRRQLRDMLRRDYEARAVNPLTREMAEQTARAVFGRTGPNSSFADLQEMCGPNSVVIVPLGRLEAFLVAIKELLSDPGRLQEHPTVAAGALGGVTFDIQAHARHHASTKAMATGAS